MYNSLVYRIFPDKIDKILDGYFKGTNRPTFMVIGANDGIRMDRLYKYIKKVNSIGILVEPVTHVFRKLKFNYGKIKKGTFYFENVAVSDREGKRYFYFFEDTTDWQYDLYGSLLKEHVKKFEDQLRRGSITKKKIHCTTVNELIRKYDFHPDLLVIDTEGYDFEIIKSIDFIKYRPKVIIYEHINLSESDKISSVALLTNEGYVVVEEVVDFLAIY